MSFSAFHPFVFSMLGLVRWRRREAEVDVAFWWGGGVVGGGGGGGGVGVAVLSADVFYQVKL